MVKAFEEWKEERAESVVHRWFETTEDGLLAEIEEAIQDAYRAGQEEMRERAAQKIVDLGGSHNVSAYEAAQAFPRIIRALPLETTYDQG